MRITKSQLTQIIKEELAGVTEKVVKRGDKYAYVSKKGKTLGTHDTKAGAEKQATAIRISRNVGEALDDRIDPDLDDLEQAGFRPDPEEVARMLAKKFPDLAAGRVTQKIGKNDLMVYIADEYDTSEQTAMQVVEEMIEEGIIGMMYPGFVNIISAEPLQEAHGLSKKDAKTLADFGKDQEGEIKRIIDFLVGSNVEVDRTQDVTKMKKEELKRIVREEMTKVISEKKKSGGKKDACYHKVKARYDVWPSAYASGALVKCRKVGAKNWGKSTTKEEQELQEGEDALEPKIRKILKDEGGAAGLDAIVKAVDADKAEVKATLKAMVDVGLHKNGDYILDDAAEVDIEKK